MGQTMIRLHLHAFSYHILAILPFFLSRATETCRRQSPSYTPKISPF